MADPKTTELKPSEKIKAEIEATLVLIQAKKDERSGVEQEIRALSKRVTMLKDNLITLLGS